MSVLESMRSGSDSTFMQVVLALVLVSFVWWGVTPNGDRSQIIATVNGVAIRDTTFNRTYRLAESSMERNGKVLSEQERSELRQRVREQLIEREVLRQRAIDLGLEVSDTEVARELLDIPLFRNEDGDFDRQIYVGYLRRQRMNEADFEQELREGLLLDKLRQLVYMGATLSEPVLQQAYLEENTKVDIRYVRIRAATIQSRIEIPAEELTSWIAENGPAIEEAYKRDFERLYNQPERATLSVIRMVLEEGGPDLEAITARMEGLRAQVEGGADFAALAREWSEDVSAPRGGDMGAVGLPQLGKDVVSAIEELQPGQLSGLVTSSRDVRFFRLEARTPAREIPLDEVREEVARRLLQEKRAPSMASEIAEKEILAAWTASGEPPQDVLDRYSLRAGSTGPITQAEGGLFQPPADMMKDARTTEPGSVFAKVYEDGDTLWVGQLVSRQEADMDLYELSKDSLRETALIGRRNRFYQGWITAEVAAADVE